MKLGKEIMKKMGVGLLAVLLMAAIPFCAQAKTVTVDNVTLEVPEGFYEFTPATPMDDPAWGVAGITDVSAKLEEYKEMGLLVNLISQDRATNISLMKRSSDYAASVYNLTELTPEEQESVLEQLTSSNSDDIKVEKFIFQIGDMDFYSVEISGNLEDGTTVNELIHGTIVNGEAYNLDVYRSGDLLTQEQKDLFASVSSSITFQEILPKPDNTVTPESMTMIIVILVVLVLLILVPVLYIPLRKRKDKRDKEKFALRLEEFRKLHGESDTVEGEMRFANSTDCTREAIRTFSFYHSYLKNLIPIILSCTLCIVAVALTFIIETEWWMKLLSVGIVVYYGYKLFTNPTAVEKVQRKVYERGRSSTAIYAFYDDAFRVSGVQSTSVYPYFQISAVKKHGHYLYLYYGPDNAYMVDTFGFKMGTAEEFEAFIQKKIKE